MFLNFKRCDIGCFVSQRCRRGVNAMSSPCDALLSCVVLYCINFVPVSLHPSEKCMWLHIKSKFYIAWYRNLFNGKSQKHIERRIFEVGREPFIQQSGRSSLLQKLNLLRGSNNVPTHTHPTSVIRDLVDSHQRYISLVAWGFDTVVMRKRPAGWRVRPHTLMRPFPHLSTVRSFCEFVHISLPNCKNWTPQKETKNLVLNCPTLVSWEVKGPEGAY